MASRQLKRFYRSKSRVIASIVNPLLWMGFLAAGWSFASKGFARFLGGVGLIEFLAPAFAVMASASLAFTGGATVIWDKEFGFLREVLVAPAPRWACILGRALGDSIVASIQGAVVLAAAIAIAGLNPSGAPLALLACFLAAMMFTSLGIALAARMRSIEGFHGTVNVLMTLVILLSGAFYPLGLVPSWLQALALLDPLTYPVDLARGALTGLYYIPASVSLTVSVAVIAGSIVLAAALFEKAAEA